MLSVRHHLRCLHSLDLGRSKASQKSHGPAIQHPSRLRNLQPSPSPILTRRFNSTSSKTSQENIKKSHFEPVNDAAVANALWEEQEGYNPLEESNSPHFTPDFGALELKEVHMRPQINLSVKPSSWRSSISYKNKNLPKTASDILQIGPIVVEEGALSDWYQGGSKAFGPTVGFSSNNSMGGAWSHKFQQLFGTDMSQSWSGKEPEAASMWQSRFDQLDLSSSMWNSPTFDIDSCREEMEMLRSRLSGALERRDVARAEEIFGEILRLQESVPQEYDRLHLYFRSAWLQMMEVYVLASDDYPKLIDFMDRFQLTYGLHQGDRALLSLRHFIANDMTTLAKEFWRDVTSSEDVLDERAYADSVVHFHAKGEIDEARVVLLKARQRSLKDPSFVLTVNYYLQAILFCIHIGDLKELNNLTARVIQTNPYGLGPPAFLTWTKAINNMILQYTSTSIDLFKLSDLKKTQQGLFHSIKALADQLAFPVPADLRFQFLRHQLLQSSDLYVTLERIREYTTTSMDVDVLNGVLESAIFHRDFQLVGRLLDNSRRDSYPELALFAPADNSSFKLVSSWIDRFLLTSFEELQKRVRVGKPTTRTDHVPKMSSSLSTIFRRPSPGLDLFEFVFLSSSRALPFASPITIGNVLLFLLELIKPIYDSKESNPTPETKKHLADARQAISSLLEGLYTQQHLMIPENKDVAYRILEKLFDVHMSKQAKEFSVYALQRLSFPLGAGIFALRIEQCDKPKDWESIHALWKTVIESDYAKTEYLVRVYAQKLTHKPRDGSHIDLIVEFLTLLLNGDIAYSNYIHYEALQHFYSLNNDLFDVPAFWALDRLRRTQKSPLTANVASMTAYLLTRRGDHFIRDESSVRLHQDFKPFILSKNQHDRSPLTESATHIFETLMDGWYSAFERSVPSQRRISTSLKHTSV